MVLRPSGRPVGPALRARFRGPPLSRRWFAAVVAPVITGWVYGAGALASAIGVPVWLAAALAIEATAGAVLAAVLLSRSAAMVTWWAAAVGCASGWVAYVAAAGPWTWTAEVSLVLPAAVLTVLWPAARACEVAPR